MSDERKRNLICRCPACAGDGGAPPAPTVSTGAGGEIPADGYYTALVNNDTGGELRKYVRVADKKAYSASGHHLKDGACSEFKPCNTWDFVYGFPKAAAKELDELRAEKARLEAWKAEVMAVEANWDEQAIARMLGARLGESTRTAIQREVPILVDRAKRLHEAGQDAIDYIDGKHRDAGRVLDGWRKANK